MGVPALHLVAAEHAAPAGDQALRTGSGGGSGTVFVNYARRIYQDPRADGPTRQLLLAIAYTAAMAPPDDAASTWSRIRTALGPGTTPIAVRRMIINDLPREDGGGGLLPCYFTADWLSIYRWAAAKPTWQPPARGPRDADIDDGESAGQRPILHLVPPPSD